MDVLCSTALRPVLQIQMCVCPFGLEVLLQNHYIGSDAVYVYKIVAPSIWHNINIALKVIFSSRILKYWQIFWSGLAVEFNVFNSVARTLR